MIKKYNLFKESLLDKLKGPTEENIWNLIKNYDPDSMLVKSCEIGYLQGVKKSLEMGADINYDNSLSLYLAVENNHINIVKYLIKNGINLEGDNNDIIKNTLLSHNSEILKILLNNVKHDIEVDKMIQLADGLKDSEMVEILKEYKNKNK